MVIRGHGRCSGRVAPSSTARGGAGGRCPPNFFLNMLLETHFGVNNDAKSHRLETILAGQWCKNEKCGGKCLCHLVTLCRQVVKRPLVTIMALSLNLVRFHVASVSSCRDIPVSSSMPSNHLVLGLPLFLCPSPIAFISFYRLFDLT